MSCENDIKKMVHISYSLKYSKCVDTINNLIVKLKKYLIIGKKTLDDINKVIPNDVNYIEAEAYYLTFKNNMSDVVYLAEELVKQLFENDIQEISTEVIYQLNVKNSMGSYFSRDFREPPITAIDKGVNQVLPCNSKFPMVLKPMIVDLPCFVQSANTDHFQAGFEFNAYVTHVEGYGRLPTFYISKMHLSSILPIVDVSRLTHISFNQLPRNCIFGLKEPGECHLKRVVLGNGQFRNKLLLIDTGERTNISKIAEYYLLPTIYCTASAQAIFCKLVKAEVHKNDKFRSLLNIVEDCENKFVSFRVHENDGLTLELIILLKTEIQPLADVTNVDVSLMNTIKMDTVIEVRPTTIDTISLFYGYIPEYIKTKPSKLSWATEEIRPLKPLFIPPRTRTLVLTQYFEDKRWYRAIVLGWKKFSAYFRVFFVDYGYTQDVPLSSLAKCYISEEDEHFCALRCRLYGPSNFLSTMCDALDESSIEQIKREIQNKTIKLRILGRSQSALLLQFAAKEFYD